MKDLKAMNIDDEFCYIAGLKNDHPENFGVLIEDGDDFLEKIIEKPKEFVGNLVNTSLYKFTPEIFEKVLQIKKSPRGEYEITDAISLLAKEKKVKIKKIDNFWMDFGRPEDVEKLSNFLQNDSKKVKNGSLIKRLNVLENGGVVIYPTDTIYGFLADAENKKAVEKIYKIKKRPKSKPLAVFVEDFKMAFELAEIDEKQKKILKQKWPGKYTFVLRRKYEKGTIALRIPR